ncbi:serine/threonine protein kinase [Blastopirellula marina]|uniref:Serine/threonine protein kinase n=1 Tax=Blastopirellula marina TaxID=124 RepID=A0A2S8F5A1_9BACT|nr:MULTISPECIES: PQQ-binding-like beta-propeller repeat protein [Pirellulaceae]PQO27327.1 serine/threonine protein kinase [Blastopirellula marina]RCS47864.1 serine/threonine protein kinase [Bremerella cremea]
MKYALLYHFASCIWITLLTLLATAESVAEEFRSAAWPSFQNGGQMSVAGDTLPTRWSGEENIAWKAEIPGYGQSTPIVTNGQIVVTSTSGPNKENYYLVAYSLESGEKLWQKEFTNPSPIENTSYVSRAAPTPIADDSGYIAYYEGGLVVAVSPKGEVRWQRDLVEAYGPIASRHGLSSSLEQNKDLVFVWVERSEEPYLAALNKETGETVWKVEGLGKTSWSTPRLIPVGDTTQLVCSASGKIAGFDPNNGNRLWQFDQIANNTTCTPIPLGDGRFLIGASEGRGEAAAQTDGTSNGVIQITKQDDGTFMADFAWQAAKAKSSFGSPIVADGTAWFINRSGVLFGVNQETGKQTTSARLAAGGVWATPLQQGNRLYIFGSKGTTSILDLPTGEIVAENSLWASPEGEEGEGSSTEILYSAVPVPPYLILRTGGTLYAVREKSSN